MSDLHCAATLVVVTATDGDPEGSLDVALLLSERRVARVYTGSVEPARGWADALARALGVDVVTLPDLDEGPVPSWVSTIADLHRGETVVVVTARPMPWEGAAPGITELSVDADGVVLR